MRTFAPKCTNKYTLGLTLALAQRHAHTTIVALNTSNEINKMPDFILKCETQTEKPLSVSATRLDSHIFILTA